MHTTISRGVVLTAFLVLLLALIPGTASGNTFVSPGCSPGNVTPPCNDVTTSLGQFILLVTDPTVIAALGSLKPAGYDPTTHIFVSPLLSDSSTVIGRSSNFTDNGSQPSQTVGLSGSYGGITTTQLSGITNSSFVAGGVPSGFPTGNDAVYTDVMNIDLTGGGFTVNAGQACSACASTSDLGKVEAQGTSNDFPAQSFFDIFADITIPGLGSVHNTSGNPLIVQATLPAGSQLPPKVIYVHGQSSVVPLVFDSANSGLGIMAGDTLGNVMLTGHGVSYNPNSPSDVAAFEAGMQQLVMQDSFNASTNPNGFTTAQQTFILTQTLPEPSTIAMMIGGLGFLYMVIRRRKA
jgi:hypothetical protein